MTRVTTTFPLNVVPAATTVVESIAAQLATEFPTSPAWSIELADSSYRYLAVNHPDRDPAEPQLTTLVAGTLGPDLDTWGGGVVTSGGRKAFRGWNNGNQSIELLMGNAGPSNLTAWDPVTKSFWHCAGTTSSYPYSQTITRYNGERDAFQQWTAIAEGDNASALWTHGAAHNFGQTTFDPNSRRIFRLLRESSGGLNTTNNWFMGWAYIDDLVAGLPRGTARVEMSAGSAVESVFVPIEYLPEVNSILMLRSGAATWPLFNISTNTWSGAFNHSGINLSNTTVPATVYHEGYVYFVADTTTITTGFWRIKADGTLAPEYLGPTPVPMNGAAYYAEDWYHTEFVSLGGVIYAFRSGNPLTPGNNGAVYKYDGSWTQVDEMPLVAMGVPTNAGYGSAGGNYVCFSVCAAEGLNCVALMNTGLGIYGANWGDRAILWKP